MKTAAYGGLAGKERRIHARDCADREYANNLIDEYFDAEDDGNIPMRSVPIRSRGEFFPSAISFPAGSGTAHWQHELPLLDESPIKGAADEEVFVTQETTPTTVARTHESIDQAKTSTVSPPRLRRGSFSPLPLDWSPRRRERKFSRFTIRGFTTGLAVGSAAAAALLLVLRATLG